MRCPCGSGDAYELCCAPLHGGAAAPNAERLMRSRYTAFALGMERYLLDSWHASTRPASIGIDPETTWLRLILEPGAGGDPFSDEAFVTFTAIARTPQGRAVQRERSRFLRDAENGGPPRWRYVDGVELDPGD